MKKAVLPLVAGSDNESKNTTRFLYVKSVKNKNLLKSLSDSMGLWQRIFGCLWARSDCFLERLEEINNSRELEFVKAAPKLNHYAFIIKLTCRNLTNYFFVFSKVKVPTQ